MLNISTGNNASGGGIRGRISNLFGGSRRVEASAVQRTAQEQQPQNQFGGTQTVQSGVEERTRNEETNNTEKTTQSINRANNSLSTHRKHWSAVLWAAKKVSSAASGYFRLLGKGAAVITKGLLSPLKKVGSAIGGLGGKIKGAFSGLLRIAKFRIFRTIVKGITTAFKEGVGNLYQYSKAINGTFAKSLDKISTNALYVKNSLGAMVAPIINAAAPAIEFLADKFVGLLNIINQVIAKMTGAKTWTKALKYPTEYAESADEATEANKKLKKSILSIDEIHALTDNSDDGSSKKKDTKDYSKMFQEVSLDNSTFGLLNSFEGLGKKIAEKINSAMKNIDWSKIKETAKGIATKIGSLINGFVAGLNWNLLGRTIGNAINTAFVSANAFVKTVKWDKIGKSIAKTLNSAFKTIDMALVGQTLANTINAPVKFAESFVYTFDWSQFGAKLSTALLNFVKTLDLNAIARTLTGLLKGLAKTAQELFTSPAWSMLGKKIRDALITFFEGNPLVNVGKTVRAALRALFDVAIELFGEKDGKSLPKALGKEVANMINDFFGDGDWWSKAGKALTKTVTGLADFLKTAILNIKPEKIEKAINTFINSIDWEEVARSIAQLFATAFIKAFEMGFGSNPLTNAALKDMKERYGWDTYGTAYKAVKARSLSAAMNSEAQKFVQRIPTKKAAGGFVNTGQTFIARESGPELVGTIGNRTAVVNNDQIVASVAQGVADANSSQNALLREQNSLLRRILEKDNGGSGVSTSEVIRTLQRNNRRNGRTVVPVGV